MGGGNRGSGKGGNRRWADDAWYRNLAPCATCGMGAKEQCHTASGRPCKPHAGRVSLKGRDLPASPETRAEGTT